MDTDEDVLRSGTQTCYRDLLVVKDWLGHDPRKAIPETPRDSP